MNPLILQHLRPVYNTLLAVRRDRALARWRVGAAAALLALFLIFLLTGWFNLLVVFAALGIAVIGSKVIASRVMGNDDDFETAIQRVEQDEPNLRAALLTAAEQVPGPGGKLNHLQETLVRNVANHALTHRWNKGISDNDQSAAARFLNLSTIGLLLCGLLAVFAPHLATHFGWHSQDPIVAKQMIEAEEEVVEPPTADDTAPFIIEVTPGDIDIERGTRLIVEAHFPERVPKAASLVIQPLLADSDSEPAPPLRIPMKLSLGDPVFAGIYSQVDADADYHVEIEGSETRSDTFRIAVYEHPQLTSANATVTPPEYTGKEPRTIKDTRRVSATEGSDIALDFTLNKPITRAQLIPVKGDAEPIPVAFATDSNQATLELAPTESGKFRLELVDADGRANKKPPVFSITILENLPPSIELVFPGKDRRVTALEEVDVKAKLWDDFGIRQIGATYSIGETEKNIILDPLPEPTEDKNGKPLKKKRKPKIQVSTRIDLEALEAQPEQVLSYHFWAEDVGPDGEVRRIFSDMFFADIRHFEETFEQMPGGKVPPGEGEPVQKLPMLQREIMSATWNQSRPGWKAGKDNKMADIGTVGEAQRIAEAMAGQALAEAGDDIIKKALQKAMFQMDQAAQKLEKIAASQPKDPSPALHDALKSERLAYQALLEAAGRHTRIQKMKSESSSSPPPEDPTLSDLELKEEELAYEEEKLDEGEQASEEQQKEDLLVLNRLRELARRQEAIADKLKELQLALEEAETEAEKEELQDALARLKEQQEELLREIDDLQEQMEQPENRARMAEESGQLEETREQVQETGEQLDQGEVEQAANSAQRAAEELEEIRDDFQERTSGEFAKEMREMKFLAKEISEEQKAISEAIDEVAQEGRPSDAAEREENFAKRESIGERTRAQEERIERLLESMTQTSEASEQSEPLLSEALYDGLRDTQMGQTEDAVEAAGKLSERGYDPQAQEAAELAQSGVDQLKEAVEKAAASVLGDEEQALRFARKQLDQAIEDLAKEIEAQTGQSPEQTGNEGQEPGTEQASNESPGEGQEQGAGEGEGQEPSEQASAKGKGKGKGQEPGEGEGQSESPSEQASAKGKGEGQEPGEGEGQSESPSEQANAKGEGQEPGEGEGQGESPSEQASAKGKGKGKGQKPGQGEGQGEGQEPSQQASAKGKGKGKGEGQGEGEGRSEQASNSPGKGKGKDEGEGQGQGQGAGQGNSQQASNSSQQTGGDSIGGTENGGDSPGGGLFFFDDLPEVPFKEEPGVLTGETEDYRAWADKLRHVEEILETPELRAQAARAADRAGDVRREVKRNDTAPSWGVVLKDVFGPLVRLRDDVDEELLRRSSDDKLAPIDRDPVPRKFEDLVRQYYKAVGSGADNKDDLP